MYSKKVSVVLLFASLLISLLFVSHPHQHPFDLGDEWKGAETGFVLCSILQDQLCFSINFCSGNGVADCECIVFEINRAPPQTQYFTAPECGEKICCKLVVKPFVVNLFRQDISVVLHIPDSFAHFCGNVQRGRDPAPVPSYVLSPSLELIGHRICFFDKKRCQNMDTEKRKKETCRLVTGFDGKY